MSNKSFSKLVAVALLLLFLPGCSLGWFSLVRVSPVSVVPPDFSWGRKEEPSSASPSSSRNQALAEVRSQVEELERLLDDPPPSVGEGQVATREVLDRHQFGPGNTFQDAFLANGLFVKFDPPELGGRRFASPVFFATTADLVRYLEEVEGLFVEQKASGVYVVRECVEAVYTVPEGVRIDPKDVALLMHHPLARFRLVDRLAYLYDDRKGQERFSAYLKRLEKTAQERATLVVRVDYKLKDRRGSSVVIVPGNGCSKEFAPGWRLCQGGDGRGVAVQTPFGEALSLFGREGTAEVFTDYGRLKIKKLYEVK